MLTRAGQQPDALTVQLEYPFMARLGSSHYLCVIIHWLENIPLVSVLLRDSQMMKYLVMDGVQKCGGSVIADKFVATASHCIRTCPDHCSQDWDRCADTPSCYVKLRSATVG